MTTDTKLRSYSTEPAATVSRSYEDDFFGWVEDQVALLKAGRVDRVDLINIADELSAVGNEHYEKLESAVRIVLLHLLKWDYQPDRRSRSWVLSIAAHRRRIVRVLRKNPSLKPHIEEATGNAYEDARGDAMNETGLVAMTFPKQCPYDWSAITARTIEWDDVRSPE
jgi:Domain of unknown function DUF29